MRAEPLHPLPGETLSPRRPPDWTPPHWMQGPVFVLWTGLIALALMIVATADLVTLARGP